MTRFIQSWFGRIRSISITSCILIGKRIYSKLEDGLMSQHILCIKPRLGTLYIYFE